MNDTKVALLKVLALYCAMVKENKEPQFFIWQEWEKMDGPWRTMIANLVRGEGLKYLDIDNGFTMMFA